MRRIDPKMVFERWQDAIKLGRLTDAVIIGLQVGLHQIVPGAHN